MAKNNYLAKQQEERQKFLTVGEETGFQKCFDLVQLCLRDPRVVGNDAWGRERIKRLFEVLVEYDKEFSPAFRCDAESDVMQEHLDRRLREIAGDKLAPFAERYPYIKMQNYGRKDKK